MLLVSAFNPAYLACGAVVSPRRKRLPPARHRMVIGGAIRFRRKSSNLTQEKLAEKVDLNPKYLGEIERGEKIISIEALLRIANELKTPIRDFFGDI